MGGDLHLIIKILYGKFIPYLESLLSNNQEEFDVGSRAINRNTHCYMWVICANNRVNKLKGVIGIT